MSSSPRQIITERQSSNKHNDPFGQMKAFMYLLVGMATFPALSLMVFLRRKLGYRVPKPTHVISLFEGLVIVSIIVNLLAYGWFFLKRDTPLGQYVNPAAAKAARRIPVDSRPVAEKWVPPGWPANWWQMTSYQQSNWMRTHPKEQEAGVKWVDDKKSAILKQEAAEDEAAATKAAYEQSYHLRDLHYSLFLFAVAFLIMGFRRRKEGAALIKSTMPRGWHTMSRGKSYLSDFFPQVSEYRMQAFYEPALCVLVGALIIRYWSISLGVWIIYAAIGMSLAEILLMEILVNEMLDKYDREIEGRHYTEMRKAIRSSAENERIEEGIGVRGATFDPETAAMLRRIEEESAA